MGRWLLLYLTTLRSTRLPWLPRGPRPYPEPEAEGRDVGGVGSRISLWTWPALVAACARGRPCALVLVPEVGAAPGSSLVVHRGQDAEVAVGDRDFLLLL